MIRYSLSTNASVAEWMRNELLHFSSGLRATARRIVDIHETIGGNEIERDQTIERPYQTQLKRRWQSGQLQETVNLPDLSYAGSNPARRTQVNKKPDS